MKSQRQAKILEIISNKNIETQEQLLAELQEEGFRGTQATISRDIKELRVVKELTSLGTYRYTVSSSDLGSSFSVRLNTIFRECVISFDYAQNIIVVRTLPGLASAAGVQVLDLQQRLANKVSSGRILVFNGTTDHLCDHVCTVQLLDGLGVDDAAVTHDGNDIAVLKNFVQLVADINNGTTPVSELVDDNTKLLQLFGSQRGTGLVHNDQFGIKR